MMPAINGAAVIDALILLGVITPEQQSVQRVSIYVSTDETTVELTFSTPAPTPAGVHMDPPEAGA